MRSAADIDVIILAGGLGTRIRPMIGDVPKFLAPVSGRPFAEYLLGELSRQGFRRFALALGHGYEGIVEWLDGSPYRGSPWVCSMEGRAAAVRDAMVLTTSDPVIILNGDTLLIDDGAYATMLHRHALQGSVRAWTIASYGRRTSAGAWVLPRSVIMRTGDLVFACGVDHGVGAFHDVGTPEGLRRAGRWLDDRGSYNVSREPRCG